jgi:hypothetical protein
MFGICSAVLYISIVLIFLGLSVIVEEFVHLLQILFLFIFLESDRLPVSLVWPLSGLKQIQFLNYFDDGARHQIEQWLLPNGFHQKSAHVFEQYQEDINFLRAVYAIIILNIIYLAVRLIAWAIFANFKLLKENSYNPYLRYLQNLRQKSFAFVDSIIRYEYMAVVWACILQFTSLTSPYSPFSAINATLCIITFVLFMAYPVFIYFYLKVQYNYMTNEQYECLYQDSLYKKLTVSQTPNENSQPYIYLLFRYYRLFVIGQVVCLAAMYNSPLAGIIPLMVVFIGEIIWILVGNIYTSKVYLGMKVVENVLLMFMTILYIVVYAQS